MRAVLFHQKASLGERVKLRIKKQTLKAHKGIIIKERNENNSDRQQGYKTELTWNMTLYCSSGFWTTHMLHPMVTFKTVLDCAGPQQSQMTSSHTRTHSIKVFVCGSGRAPPSMAGLWYITRLLLRITQNTSLPGTDIQFNWLRHSSPVLTIQVW